MVISVGGEGENPNYNPNYNSNYRSHKTITRKYYKNVTKTVLGEVTAQPSWGTLSIANNRNGNALTMTTTAFVGANSGQNIIYRVDITDSDYYIDKDSELILSVESANAKDSYGDVYGISGITVSGTDINNNKQVLFENLSFITHKWDRTEIVVTITTRTTEEKIKHLDIYFQRSGAYGDCGKLSIKSKKTIESTSSDYDFYVDEPIFKSPKHIVRKYYRYSTTPNIVTVGNPTIDSSGIISDFTSSNYAKTPSDIYFTAIDNWEFVTRLYITGTGRNPILAYPRSSGYTPTLLIQDRKIRLALSNNTSAHFANVVGATTLDLNTWYYIKFEFTGTAYNIYYSTSGTIWVKDGTVASTTKLNDRALTNIGYSYDYQSGYAARYLKIDLRSTHIKTNGVEVWHGTTTVEGTSSSYDFYVDESTYRGINQQGE